ncbi:polyketide cyclase/dehydrase/lipid transport protein [Nocardia tenerifensis]|uniref:Polyketide cyclase/dehydrase/lipid transport protein n=1 Tax=Nocardia tenerifensis TaxID=228006 RepID=A0A318KC26_9NOCA|nr:SRPBCC family protein [Nocardia tenerifensis]PXX69066.1 polyketide cyclase/dehydrase/lipid transport protein [Nocardia tenerifensis]
MTIIATAQATSAAPPAAFFAKWADMATWPEWNKDTEWVRLDGPFVQGATGTLKPKGGPKVSFVVERLTDDAFVDVSRLIGARLIFDHRVAVADGRTTVTVTVSIEGPLRRLWTKVMGRDLAASVGPDLAALVAVAEGVPA